jgi:hypothetical protein
MQQRNYDPMDSFKADFSSTIPWANHMLKVVTQFARTAKYVEKALTGILPSDIIVEILSL